VLAGAYPDYVYCCRYILEVNPKSRDYKYVSCPEQLLGVGPDIKIIRYETFREHPKRQQIQIEVEQLQFMYGVEVHWLFDSEGVETWMESLASYRNL